MDVLSKHYGYVLIFDNREDLERVQTQITRMLREVEEGKLGDSPYLYAHCIHPTVGESFIEEQLKLVKQRLANRGDNG